MTLSQKAVEAAADAMERGVCQYCRTPASGDGGGITDGCCSYPTWAEPTNLERAKIVLSAALAVDGLCLVPKEPTQEMLDAALALDAVSHGVLVPARPADVWAAMIAAASDEEGK